MKSGAQCVPPVEAFTRESTLKESKINIRRGEEKRVNNFVQDCAAELGVLRAINSCQLLTNRETKRFLLNSSHSLYTTKSVHKITLRTIKFLLKFPMPDNASQRGVAATRRTREKTTAKQNLFFNIVATFLFSFLCCVAGGS